ncbi:MAG TPA: cytochrome c [Thermoanaerobaculia bacterium]|nr:cytochrome c [Thermoanaerobaculia bacterium]
MRRSLLLAVPAALVLALAAPARAQTGHSENYTTYCAVCHGDDGKAQTEKGKEKRARDFTNKKWQEKVADDRLETSITKGHDKMPAFKSKLSADEIKALVKEVRSFAQ